MVPKFYELRPVSETHGTQSSWKSPNTLQCYGETNRPLDAWWNGQEAHSISDSFWLLELRRQCGTISCAPINKQWNVIFTLNLQQNLLNVSCQKICQQGNSPSPQFWLDFDVRPLWTTDLISATYFIHYTGSVFPSVRYMQHKCTHVECSFAQRRQ